MLLLIDLFQELEIDFINHRFFSMIFSIQEKLLLNPLCLRPGNNTQED